MIRSTGSTLLCIGVTLGGCGTVMDDSGADAGTDENGTDITSPTLVSATPADGANKVGVLEALAVTFDEPLDPGSVTEQAFVLTSTRHWTGSYSRSYAVTVSYDDETRTVTLTPDRELDYDTRYDLAIGAGLTDVAGNPFGGKRLAFRTYTNSTTRQVVYSNPSGAIGGWYSYVVDATGHVTRQLYMNMIGADATWFTSDDRVATRSQLSYDEAGRLSQIRGYSLGPDLDLNTADDPISSMTTYAYDATGRQTMGRTAHGTGPDTQWGTADDLITSYQTQTWLNGNLVHEITFTGRGNDNVWHTADDQVSTYYAYAYDAQRNRTRVTLHTPGADHLALTSDDGVSVTLVYEYDARGNVLRERRHTQPGGDGQWFTPDDVITRMIRFERDARGRDLTTYYHQNPGPDATWLTADDSISPRIERTLDANGQVLTSTTYLTDVYSYVVYAYTAAGNRSDYKFIGGPGGDGVWKTADDLVTNNFDFDTSN